MRARRCAVARDQLGGHPRRRLDQVAVALQIGKAQQRRAALALAQEFARAAQQKVLARDLETVARFADQLDAFAGISRQLAVEQDADALARAAPDPPAQL